MLSWKNCAHWIGRIDHQHESCLLVDQLSHILKVNLEILISLQLICDSFPSQSRADIFVEWITNFRNKNLFSLVCQGHANCKEAHIDSVVYVHIRNLKRKFGIVQLSDCLSERWDPSGADVAMSSLVSNALFDYLVTLVECRVPLSGIWNCFCP